MNVTCALKAFLVLTITFFLFGCAKGDEEARNLGFANEREMNEMRAKGFETKAQFDIAASKAKPKEETKPIANQLEADRKVSEELRVEESLPKIVAACGVSGGQKNARLVTDTSANRLYFGSIYNQGSLELTKISGPIRVSKDELTFQFFSADGKAEHDAEFSRRTGVLKQERVHKHSSQGPYNLAQFNLQFEECEKLADEEHSSVLATLKEGRKIGEQRENARADEAKRARDAENARPNKF